jgi:two-component system OmpR family sensor kinase
MGIRWADGPSAMFDHEAEQRHELRSALFGIEASAHGLSYAQADLTSTQINQLAQAMLHEVRRVRSMIEGRVSDAAAFDLATAIGPAIVSAQACGQQLQSDVPTGLFVDGCPETATQVVVALLENARRHAPGAPVELRASVRRGSVFLHVEDRGPGIAWRMRRRVFDRGICRVGGNGSGLGLFIARRLMSEQGGTITARSRRGGGTSFVLRFRSADPR